MADKKSVVVVGGGWCGLYALKWFLQEGLDAVLYEKTESLGKATRPGFLVGTRLRQILTFIVHRWRLGLP